MRSAQRRGFTLLEILVVLAISAVVATISLAGFSSLRQGSQRTTCQTNLTQIYQACRLYGQDYGAFPYFDRGDGNTAKFNTATPGPGIGLWNLVADPLPGDNTGKLADVQSASQFTHYLRNVNALHCPADDYDRYDLNSAQLVPSTSVYSNGTRSTFNTGYLSYQVRDTPEPKVDNADPTPVAQYTYSSFRQLATATPLQHRQLVPDPTDFSNGIPDGSTVVTWCRFHRKLVKALDTSGDQIVDGDGNPVWVPTHSSRNFDNVLFYDGSIQLVPNQSFTDSGSRCKLSDTNCAYGWQRMPRPLH